MTWRGAEPTPKQDWRDDEREPQAGPSAWDPLLVGWRQSLSMMRHRKGPPLARRFGFAAIRGLTVLLRMTSQGQPEPQRADSAVVAHGNAWMPIPRSALNMTTVQTESLGVLSVNPQGGYLAKSCPEAVQLDVLRPVEPLPASQFMTMLAVAGKTLHSARSSTHCCLPSWERLRWIAARSRTTVRRSRPKQCAMALSS